MSQRRFNRIAPVAFAVLAIAVGCASVNRPANPGDGGTETDTAGDRPPGLPGTAGTTGAAGAPGPGTAGTTGTGTGGAGGACTPTVSSCTPTGGQYCGLIGNGCPGGSIQCGDCPADWACNLNICVGGASCRPLTCASGGAVRYCGKIGDNCGRELDCGACAAGEICSGGLCVQANCTPITCSTAAGGRYCGRIGDGCGGALDCGGCTAPLTCGGAGIANACGALDCPTRISCTPTGGQYCGVIGNGCGGTQDCGACANGMPCGTGAMAGICPSSGPGPCTGLQCKIQEDKMACGNAITSISGRIFDPAGKNPLYNVVVYVPNMVVAPIATGASCDRCDSPISGQPVAAALTDARGNFKMDYAPSGTNIPLVIQIGKWRRQITLPQVTACRDNAFNDANLMRLPRSQGEGHLPRIALPTGNSDAMECLLRKIGISDSEFTNDAGTGRVHLYVGGAGDASRQGATRLASGATFADAYTTLYNSYTKLVGYDIVILGCEGSQLEDAKAPHVGNLKRFADNGGRIFATHRQVVWAREGLPPWPAAAQWGAGSWDAEPTTVTGLVDTSFAKGAALADWLVTVQASTTRGQIPLTQTNDSILNVMPPAQRWIYTSSPGTTQQYVTFNTPLEAAAVNQCGRVALTDVHVGTASGADSSPTVPFPMGCGAAPDLSPQEKALEFMFFDLSSCVQIDTGTPMTPPIPIPGGAPTPPPTASDAPPPPPPPVPPPPPPVVF